MPRDQIVQQEDIVVDGHRFIVTRIPTATSGIPKAFLIASSISTLSFAGGFRQPRTSPLRSSMATAPHISQASWTVNQLPEQF